MIIPLHFINIVFYYNVTELIVGWDDDVALDIDFVWLQVNQLARF